MPLWFKLSVVGVVDTESGVTDEWRSRPAVATQPGPGCPADKAMLVVRRQIHLSRANGSAEFRALVLVIIQRLCYKLIL